MLNTVIVMGRLTGDPQLRQTQGAAAVTNFTLAVDRNFIPKETGQRETDFLDVVAFQKTAEFVCQNFTKGRTLVVTGRLQVRSWEDSEGKPRKKTEIVADRVYFADAMKRQESRMAGLFQESEKTEGPGNPWAFEEKEELPF